MELERLLDELIDRLNKEKDLLILSLKDKKKSEAILQVVEVERYSVY